MSALNRNFAPLSANRLNTIPHPLVVYTALVVEVSKANNQSSDSRKSDTWKSRSFGYRDVEKQIKNIYTCREGPVKNKENAPSGSDDVYLVTRLFVCNVLFDLYDNLSTQNGMI